MKDFCWSWGLPPTIKQFVKPVFPTPSLSVLSWEHKCAQLLGGTAHLGESFLPCTVRIYLFLPTHCLVPQIGPNFTTAHLGIECTALHYPQHNFSNHQLPSSNFSPSLTCMVTALWCAYHNWPFKQGSSENDGRSDVYYCSEFKVISNYCYNNCCCTNCSDFTWFYLIYLNLPKFT